MTKRSQWMRCPVLMQRVVVPGMMRIGQCGSTSECDTSRRAGTSGLLLCYAMCCSDLSRFPVSTKVLRGHHKAQTPQRKRLCHGNPRRAARRMSYPTFGTHTVCSSSRLPTLSSA
eukprot:1486373-Rhodomonas_salina.4